MNSKAESHLIVSLLIAALAGLIFGLGLTYSEMVNPARVIGFLDLAGSWDPTLAFVLIGALAVAIPGFQIGLRMRKPVCEQKFTLPSSNKVDGRLLSGAAIFGVGWGLAGLCPGPAIVGLGTLMPQVLGFVLAMIFGMLIYRFSVE